MVKDRKVRCLRGSEGAMGRSNSGMLPESSANPVAAGPQGGGKGEAVTGQGGGWRGRGGERLPPVPVVDEAEVEVEDPPLERAAVAPEERQCRWPGGVVASPEQTAA